jgi:DNA-binding MarR family transcriptional regulator
VQPQPARGTGTREDHAASLLYVIGRVNQGIRRELRERLGGLSLSVQEFTALSVLASRPGLSNAQLARRALVAPQSMIEILAKLEMRELVSRHADPRQGHILRASLTPAGHALLAAAAPAVQALADELFGELPARDGEAAMQVMTSAMNRLSRRGENTR